VSDSTLETPQVLGSEARRSSSTPDRGGPRLLLRRHVWWLVALLVVAVAGALIAITGTRPGYDPYGWLDWGYHTLRLNLDLGGAPSWKPFTYIFDVPYNVFGHYALWLWMLTAVAGALGGAVFGGRIAYRLTAAEGGGETGVARYAPVAAAIFAGAAVLGIQQYFHYILSAQSDPILVTVCLAAIDCHLNGRHRWAWWLLALASLGRPEVWAFAGLYAIWMFRREPEARWMLYLGVIINAFLWFGIPEITNHRPNIAGQLALRSPRELHSNKVTGTFNRFTALDYLPVQLAALLGVGLALLRRNRVVLVLAAAVLLWVAVEIAFALHGFAGVPRYLFEAGALTAVLAGVTFGWLLLDASRFDRRLPGWAGIPLAVVLVATMVPGAISQVRAEHKDVFHERLRTTQINKLSAYINALGGYKHVLACGRPVTNVEYVSILAWYTHQNTGKVGHRPKFELHQKYPIVMFTPFPNGWGAQAYRSPAGLQGTCAKILSIYVPTAHHPQGVLIPK
jgi:hypothetical protein